MKLKIEDSRYGESLVYDLHEGTTRLKRNLEGDCNGFLSQIMTGPHEIAILHKAISRAHGEFSYDGESLTYVDTNSKNGTYLPDGSRLAENQTYKLASGSELNFIRRRFRISVLDNADETMIG